MCRVACICYQVLLLFFFFFHSFLCIYDTEAQPSSSFPSPPLACVIRLLYTYSAHTNTHRRHTEGCAYACEFSVSPSSVACCSTVPTSYTIGYITYITTYSGTYHLLFFLLHRCVSQMSDWTLVHRDWRWAAKVVTVRRISGGPPLLFFFAP